MQLMNPLNRCCQSSSTTLGGVKCSRCRDPIERYPTAKFVHDVVTPDSYCLSNSVVEGDHLHHGACLARVKHKGRCESSSNYNKMIMACLPAGQHCNSPSLTKSEHRDELRRSYG